MPREYKNWFLPLGAVLLQSLLGAFPLASSSVWAQAPPAGENQAAAPASAPNPEEVVLTVGDKKITAAEFDKIVSSLPPQYSGAVASLGKKGFADQLANFLGLSMEGEKRKLDQQEGFRQMLDFQRLLLLAQVTMNELANTIGLVGLEDVRNYYTSHQAEFEVVKVRGIYVAFEGESAPGETPGAAGSSPKPIRSEPEAKAKAEALRNRIQAGEDMVALAKTESDHASAAQGGDFGYVRRKQLIPEMDDAIFSLAANQVSAPIRDRFGYFIFQVEGKRAQPLGQVRQGIENNLRQQKINDLLAKIRNDYPVTLNPNYFPEPPPGIPSPAQPAP